MRKVEIVLTNGQRWVINYLVASELPMNRVAFYDRASTPNQRRNSMRSHYCRLARTVVENSDLSLVESDNNPNGPECFLDVVSSETELARHQLEAALQTDADTIAFFAIDRLARDADIAKRLQSLVKEAGKNLVFLERYEDYFVRAQQHEEFAKAIIKDLKANMSLKEFVEKYWV